MVPEKKPNIVFFISCDIKNATAYKRAKEKTWMFRILHYLQEVERIILNEFRGKVSAEQWKRLGDETILAIFPRNDKGIQDIYNCVITINEKIIELSEKEKLHGKLKLFVAGYTFYDKPIAYGDDERSDDKFNTELTNKGFINVMFDTTVPSDNNEIVNQTVSVDFLGEDIDIGFRLSNFTEEGKILLSAKAAFLFAHFCQNSFRISKVKKVKRLKGVWNGKKYPIIFLEKNITEPTKHFSKVDKSYKKANPDKPIGCFLSLVEKILSNKVT